MGSTSPASGTKKTFFISKGEGEIPASGTREILFLYSVFLKQHQIEIDISLWFILHGGKYNCLSPGTPYLIQVTATCSDLN